MIYFNFTVELILMTMPNAPGTKREAKEAARTRRLIKRTMQPPRTTCEDMDRKAYASKYLTVISSRTLYCSCRPRTSWAKKVNHKPTSRRCHASFRIYYIIELLILLYFALTLQYFFFTRCPCKLLAFFTLSISSPNARQVKVETQPDIKP